MYFDDSFFLINTLFVPDLRHSPDSDSMRAHGHTPRFHQHEYGDDGPRDRPRAHCNRRAHHCGGRFRLFRGLERKPQAAVHRE